MKSAKQLRKDLATAKAQVTRISNRLAVMQARKDAQVAKVAKVELTEADKAPLKFGDYSDKCIAVYGGTKSRLDTLKALKAQGLCSFNHALRIGKDGAKDDAATPQGGWLFFKSKTATIADVKKLFN